MGESGPCGPDTEIFYDMQPDGPQDETPATGSPLNPARFWEVWNNVFMQYEKHADGSYGPSIRRNVDTGLGLERTLAILQHAPSCYATDLFVPILETVQSLAARTDRFAGRVIADHLRVVIFILAEGIIPGNAGQPYIARRLIRRAIRYGRDVGIHGQFLGRVAEAVIPTLADAYPELEARREPILAALDAEEVHFGRTLRRGEDEFHKAVAVCRSQDLDMLPGSTMFHLYDTYGFPPELTQELATQAGLDADLVGYQASFAEHQAKSRQGAAGRFKSGLAERSPETTKLHTATHLLHTALRCVFGPHVQQRGSNITTERLRFDFSHDAKLTEGELAEVEQLVNAQIARALPVSRAEMALEQAQASGAIGLFEARYGEVVTVYTIGDFSQEICAGPHVDNTAELGRFRILKEEAVGAGVRRIRAVLE